MSAEGKRMKAPFSPPDVSWTKYSGSVPEGIIACGSIDGETVYAGRVYFESELLVGTAFLKKGCCVFTRNGTVHESSDFEVLSVPVGEPLEWQKVDPDTSLPEMNLLDSGRIIEGIDLSIGRIVDGDNTFVGWVDIEKKLAYIPQRGTEKVFSEFELLIHKYLQFLCICPPCIPDCERETSSPE